jgi:Cu/Ag efflux protein CusF
MLAGGSELNHKLIVFGLLVAVTVCVCGSCKGKKTARAVNVYHGVGVVESVDTDTKQIQISHEEIKDYMPAMSMPYRVKRKSLMDGLKAGDKIEFTLHDSGDGPVLTEIKKTDSTGDATQKTG